MVTIEIWSDIACPFCYIGQAHLAQAMDGLPDDSNIRVEWKSFLLDPSLPEDTGDDIFTSLSERKGMPLPQVKEMTGRVEAMARRAGLDMDIERARPVTTVHAHKLLQYAKTQGVGDPMKKALFAAYFNEGAQIAQRATLIDIAASIGIDRSDAEAALDDPQYMLAVEADVAEARRLGVTGVPFFVINRKQAISGAQPPEVLQRVIAEALSTGTLEAKTAKAGGAHCATDENCD